MIVKALLIVWIGSLDHQVLDIEKFDSLAECKVALAYLDANVYGIHTGKYVKCVPYEFNQ